VDSKTKTRTCIYNPCGDLLLDEVNPNIILQNIDLVLFDGKHSVTAYEVAKEARNRSIFTILDAEIECLNSPKFSELFSLCNLIKCGEFFPLQFTGKGDLLEAMEHLLTIGDMKTSIITTRGSWGSILIKRGSVSSSQGTVSSFKELENEVKNIIATDCSVQVSYQLKPHKWSPNKPTIVIYSTCFPLDPKRIIDSTGAGDAYLGSLAYSVWKKHSEDKMLSLASFISSMKCTDTGIKGIPRLSEIPEYLK